MLVYAYRSNSEPYIKNTSQALNPAPNRKPGVIKTALSQLGNIFHVYGYLIPIKNKKIITVSTMN